VGGGAVGLHLRMTCCQVGSKSSSRVCSPAPADRAHPTHVIQRTSSNVSALPDCTRCTAADKKNKPKTHCPGLLQVPILQIGGP